MKSFRMVKMMFPIIMVLIIGLSLFSNIGCGGGGGGGGEDGGSVPTSSPTVGETGTVTGTILDVDGSPLEGATVSWESTDSKGGSTTTDSNGQYTLSGVTVGNQTIKAVKGSTVVYIQVNVQINITVTIEPVQVEPAGSLGGKVISANTNNPLSGVRVEVYIPDKSRVYIGDYTDSSGNYSISELPEGTMTIQASASGYSSYLGTVTIIAETTITHNISLYSSSSPTPSPTTTTSPNPSPTVSPGPGTISVTIDAKSNCINLNNYSSVVENQSLTANQTYTIQVSSTANYSSGEMPVCIMRGDSTSGVKWECLENGDSSTFNIGTNAWIKAFFYDNDTYDNTGSATVTIKKSGTTVVTMTIDAESNCLNLNDISQDKKLDIPVGTYTFTVKNTANFSNGEMPVCALYYNPGTSPQQKYTVIYGNDEPGYETFSQKGWAKVFYIDNDTGDNTGSGTITGTTSGSSPTPTPSTSPNPDKISVTIDAKSNCINLNNYTSTVVTKSLTADETYKIEVSSTANYSSGKMGVYVMRGDNAKGVKWECLYDGEYSEFDIGTNAWIKAFFLDNDTYDNSGSAVITIKKSGTVIGTMNIDAKTNCLNLNNISQLKKLDIPSGEWSGSYSSNASFSTGELPAIIVGFSSRFTPNQKYTVGYNGDSVKFPGSGWLKVLFIDNDTGDNSGSGTVTLYRQ